MSPTYGVNDVIHPFQISSARQSAQNSGLQRTLVPPRRAVLGNPFTVTKSVQRHATLINILSRAGKRAARAGNDELAGAYHRLQAKLTHCGRWRSGAICGAQSNPAQHDPTSCRRCGRRHQGREVRSRLLSDCRQQTHTGFTTPETRQGSKVKPVETTRMKKCAARERAHCLARASSPPDVAGRSAAPRDPTVAREVIFVLQPRKCTCKRSVEKH